MPEVILTQDELTALCAEWQKVLRLQDWDVTVRIKRERDFTENEREGENLICHSQKKSLIRILDSADYDPDCLGEQDMEVTLVHELLHLLLLSPDTKGDTPVSLIEEQAIHAISSALVGLKRKESANHQADDNLDAVSGTE